jgi:hypothetical protein
MIAQISLILLCVGVLSTVSGCTLDAASIGVGVGVGPSYGADPFYWDDYSSRGSPWHEDWHEEWLYRRWESPWGYRRYPGHEP